ncbi:hypothetical protein [Microbacterium ulmi]|uniref:WxL domain-containing protein n=1 Tax=Microbacterium ulmi TaxID=179095 RepID=A0A7Y2LYA8_9MICO|nr:hypothetical protein [Microbacterium ulmi]NII68486.1 hypothetical protein [Microbacterium ulmi]NNH02992.1 hypothetical protein [Microbacterium ulmi]
MKTKKSFALRVAAAAFGVAVLTAAGTAIASADDELGDEGVDVNVDISPIVEPGVLALSVADDSTTLTEDGSTDVVRQFTGTLPLVTVTDTRTGDEIPDGAFWAVVGSASAFLNQTAPDAAPIGADHLGWEPALVQGEGEAFISVGDDVQTVLDGDRGLVNQELLFLADSAADAAAAGGTWSANANLFLRVPATVTPGSYTSVLTLSLFE